MKIIVKENHFKKIMETEGNPSDILIEQVAATANPTNQLLILQQKINDIINDPKRISAILNNVNLNVVHSGNEKFELHIGGAKYPMRKTAQGIYALVIPRGKTLVTSNIPISLLMPEIEKIPEYKEMVEANPKIKAQLAGRSIKNELYAGDTAEVSFFKLTIKGPDSRELTRADKKQAIDINRNYPLGEFFNRNEVIFKFPESYGEIYAVLQAEDINTDLTPITLIPAPAKVKPQQQQINYAPINVDFSGLGDVFNFGDVTFKDEESVNNALQGYINGLKQNINTYGQPFIAHIKNQSPTIKGYSSRDGDPNEQIRGQYQPCAGNKTRAEYDKCLSHERAKLIANILNKGLSELGGVFQFEGMGETTEFGPGWTPENKDDITPVDTAANRRYVLDRMKPFKPQTSR